MCFGHSLQQFSCLICFVYPYVSLWIYPSILIWPTVFGLFGFMFSDFGSPLFCFNWTAFCIWPSVCDYNFDYLCYFCLLDFHFAVVLPELHWSAPAWTLPVLLIEFNKKSVHLTLLFALGSWPGYSLFIVLHILSSFFECYPPLKLLIFFHWLCFVHCSVVFTRYHFSILQIKYYIFPLPHLLVTLQRSNQNIRAWVCQIKADFHF